MYGASQVRWPTQNRQNELDEKVKVGTEYQETLKREAQVGVVRDDLGRNGCALTVAMSPNLVACHEEEVHCKIQSRGTGLSSLDPQRLMPLTALLTPACGIEWAFSTHVG